MSEQEGTYVWGVGENGVIGQSDPPTKTFFVPAGTVPTVGDTPEVAALRARLAAAEARIAELTSMLQAREAQRDDVMDRYDDEHERAERLAAYARARINTDKAAALPCANWTEILRGWAEQADSAYAALQPGDLGEEGEP